MSQFEDDDSKPWTEHDLKEAIRRINAGEINFKEAENYYGISPRTIHRQRAIENMRAQLNPEKAKKLKSGAVSNAKKDLTILRKPVEMSCTSLGDVVSLLTEGSEEVKQLLNYECDLIYECKVCKSLFRSLLNFISHKRVYCCDMFSVAHIQTDENGDGAVAANSKVEEKLKAKENLKEFTSRPFRVTCRKDLTTVLKRISALSSEFVSADPVLHLQSMENTPFALQQIILPNPHPEELTVASTLSNAVDKKLTVPEVESKKETSKPPEKTKSTSQPSETVAVKPCSVDSDKRSKCPLCPKHFSTKKSVLRHLKSIHHKSEEQVEKLKKRLQLFNVKKKSKPSTVLTVPKAVTLTSSSSVPPVKSTPAVPSSSSNENTSPILATKNDQNAEKAHTRTSRKNMSNDGDTDAKIESGDDPKSSVVSSTPANASGRASKSEPNNALTKKPVPSTSQKKVAQPSSTSLPVSSSSSKKIGIQVRIDYCKDGINQSAISAGLSPAGVPSPSGPPPTCSGDSRRSSIAGVNRDEKSEGSKSDLPQSHNTRSTSKSRLANILKSLRDKGEVRNEMEDPVIERIEWNAMSVYCEDCKTAYALNDQRWDAGSSSPRTFKCALQDCDFRSSIKNELLPHLSAEHTSLSENALAEMASIFIAEALGEGKFCCHRERSGELPLDNRKSDTTGKSRAVSAATKRKIKRESNPKPSKRKVDISVKAEFAAVPIVPLKANDKTAATMWTSTNNNHQKVVLIPEEKSKPRARKQVVLDGKRNVTPNVLQTSGDESSHFAPAKTLKNRNPLLGEMQVASTLPAVNALVDPVRLPSTPDPSDLDPTTMSEENLKKSVMTIIFGKDVPDENIDANIVDNREKSPDSSSTSSDSGKEKRYGLRAVKPAKKGLVSSVPENKDDKMWKPFMNHQNKVKSASR